MTGLQSNHTPHIHQSQSSGTRGTDQPKIQQNVTLNEGVISHKGYTKHYYVEWCLQNAILWGGGGLSHRGLSRGVLFEPNGQNQK